MTLAALQTIEWLGLRLKVPQDWEIVRHSPSLESGSLVLVDRRRERLRVAWQRCAREPDLARMLEDRRHQDLAVDPEARIVNLRGWRALSGASALRAVRFDGATGRLLEASVPEAEDAALIHGVELFEDPASARRWRAFGLDVTTPAGFRLLHASVKPADAAFEFGRDGAAGKVRRLGMASSWYTGDARSLLRREVPGADLAELAPAPQAVHEARCFEGYAPGPRISRLLRRVPVLRVRMWHCETHNAVFWISTESPRRHPVLPETFQVDCCCGGAHG